MEIRFIKITFCLLFVNLVLGLGHREATWDELKASAKINDMTPYGRSVNT